MGSRSADLDMEKLSVQERKELFAKLKVHFCLCNVPSCGIIMSVVSGISVMQHTAVLHTAVLYQLLTVGLRAWHD